MPTVTVHPVLSPVKHGGRKVPPGGIIPAADLSDDEARALTLLGALGPAEERESDDGFEHDAPHETGAAPLGPQTSAEGDGAFIGVIPTSAPPAETAAETTAAKPRAKKAAS